MLTGEKIWISLADVADNFLVFAWTDLEKKKQRDPSGMSAFIVERAFSGFSSATLTEKWGILAGNTGSFKMDEVEVPRENLVGREGEGFKIAMFALDQGRFTVAAGATGLIRACRDASVTYAKERKTFGVEIGSHQLVKEMIAQMESDYQTVASPVAAGRLAEEHRPAQHARDRPGEVVCDRGVGARGRRRRADSRCERLLRRVSCRAVLPQLQRGGDLRGHARDPQDHAGGLPARLPGRIDRRGASCPRTQVKQESNCCPVEVTGVSP